MSKTFEAVIPMPPLSLQAIEELAMEVLRVLSPPNASDAQPLDVADLVDCVLPGHGIFVCPVNEHELVGEEGHTDPVADDEDIFIKLHETQWKALFAGGRQAFRPRATVAHELGHGIMHVGTIRKRLRRPHPELMLSRVDSRSIKPFRNPEWQAWAFAGCLLAPRFAIDALPDATLRDLSSFFQMSEVFMQAHLRRLPINGR